MITNLNFFFDSIHLWPHSISSASWSTSLHLYHYNWYFWDCFPLQMSLYCLFKHSHQASVLSLFYVEPRVCRHKPAGKAYHFPPLLVQPALGPEQCKPQREDNVSSSSRKVDLISKQCCTWKGLMEPTELCIISKTVGIISCRGYLHSTAPVLSINESPFPSNIPPGDHEQLGSAKVLKWEKENKLNLWAMFRKGGQRLAQHSLQAIRRWYSVP